jgi:hypothetical protein
LMRGTAEDRGEGEQQGDEKKAHGGRVEGFRLSAGREIRWLG